MTVFRWIFAVLVVGAVVVVAAGSLKPRPAPPTRVQTTKAVRASITRTVSAAGKLEPLRRVNVSSNITGVLVDLKVGIGSEVKKGQYIGQIDTSRYRAMVEQQRAQVAAATSDVERERAARDRARADVDRLEKLVARSAAGAAELDQARSALQIAEANYLAAQSRLKLARAALEEAQKSLEWATLRAPVDGTVISVNKRVGERIRGSDFAEDVVVVIGTLEEMDVRIEVGEHDVVHIRPGQKASIEIDALPDLVLEGEVIDSGRDAIVKNAGTENEVTTFPVWVSLLKPPPTALSGMSAQVVIATDTKHNVVAVPIQAVTVRPSTPKGPPGRGPLAQAEPGGAGGADSGKKDDKAATDAKPDAPPPASASPPGKPGGKVERVVFVVKDGKVERRPVVTGISSDSLVEIIDGLEEGEEVVEGPYRVLARELQDGMAVEVDRGGDGRRGGAGRFGDRGGRAGAR